ncbi:EamA family transporter [Amycolatopsis antarctica]|uniref:EamA family transporter n=1 Tax=Amycolatopsis antarctica TaxID=1854586 RepID=A0A263D1D7_9PSEU|nr:EamA family transporter [Amycolatopsis antarctica]OZM72252.1 EamA family transporter [Amycolatopsis antarctica]
MAAPARSVPTRPAPVVRQPLPTDDLVGAGLVLGGQFSMQCGAAIAVLLFVPAGSLGVVALRLGLAAVVLLLLCRPRLRGYGRAEWGLVLAFGTALASMNTMLYQAIDRIPLGAAVTLEVLGPLTLSVVSARRASAWLWAVLALAGVALLGHGGLGTLNPAGVLFALGAGASWAAYIVLSARTARRFPRTDGLALSLTVAAVLVLPGGIAGAGQALLDPSVLGLGAAVALLSSALPYSLEMASLRRIPAATFAVLMSLAPAMAALAGLVVLGQPLRVAEAAGTALVVVAGIGAVRSAGRVSAPGPSVS